MVIRMKVFVESAYWLDLLKNSCAFFTFFFEEAQREDLFLYFQISCWIWLLDKESLLAFAL